MQWRFIANYTLALLFSLTEMTGLNRLLGLAVCAYVLVQGQQVKPAPQNATKDQPCPDEIETTGRYVNNSYGFSIRIPTGLKGVWNSARCVNGNDGCVCMSDHGRIIPLATTPNDTDHWIEAYAAFATHLHDPTVSSAVHARLDWIRERSRDGSMSVLRRSDVTVGGLKGKRVVTHYVDKETSRPMVEDFVETLRGERDVEYSLYLRTPADAYERDKPVFDNVLRSLTLSECGNC